MKTVVFVTLGVALAAAGCGGSKHAATSPPPAPPPPSTAATTQTTPSAGALQAEAKSAATGDIPDNQVFVPFPNPRGGYTVKYPEGWAQSGGGTAVVIRDKNNIIRILVRKGPLPAATAVKREVSALPNAQLVSAPQSMSLPSGRALKVVYSTQSAPNAVTGKRVTLVVDRYYLSRGGKAAIVDLGTPQGVDNVDAYRLIIKSFRWR